MLSHEVVQQKIQIIINEIREGNFDQVEELLMSLISIRNINTSYIAEACLEQNIFLQSIVYKDASEKTRDTLIHKLLTTDNSLEASHLLCCLAMIGDDYVQQVFKELQANPLPWRKELYVDPSVYAHNGGWAFREDGNKEALIYEECRTFVTGERKQYPILVGEMNGGHCPSCGCDLLDILTIDGSDEKLKFLNLEGIVKVTICPNCIYYEEAIFCKYELNGESHLLNMESKEENMLTHDDVKKMTTNRLTLSHKPVSKYYGITDEINTIGGMAEWIQDFQYLNCPKCNKIMKYFAQIHWNTIDEYADGTLYFEICHECQIIAIHHQQT
jgi:hypothetical protein